MSTLTSRFALGSGAVWPNTTESARPADPKTTDKSSISGLCCGGPVRHCRDAGRCQFSRRVEPEQGSSYGFLLHTATGRSTAWQYGVPNSSPDPYPGGNRITGGDGVIRAPFQTSGDLIFQVTVLVPAPASFPLAMLGFGGLALRQRRLA